MSCSSTKNEPLGDEKFSISDSTMALIDTSEVLSLPLEQELTLTGKIIADENNIVQIYPLVGGTVIEVNAELGDLVTTTKALAKIKSGEVAEYEREQIEAKAEYDVAKKNLAIEEELFVSKFSSERELITAKKAFEKADAELKKINEILEVYKINSNGEYVVTSPVAGFIIEKVIGPDVQIRSDMTESIFKVARLDHVYASVNIYESDISKIKIGMKAKVNVFSYSDTVFEGTITRIINVLNPETKTMEARIKLDNPEFLLKPDMSCSVVLNFQEEKQMLSVPSSSIIFDKSKNFVMIYKSRNEIETREVIVFSDINNKSFISSGLNLNEKVISKNSIFIYDAMND
jgi:cobalt-zinc-cadmium efflux system membrane fusion protein